MSGSPAGPTGVRPDPLAADSQSLGRLNARRDSRIDAPAVGSSGRGATAVGVLADPREGELVDVVPEHPARAARHRQFRRGLPAAILLLRLGGLLGLAVAVAAGSRLLMDRGGANQPGPTTAPGSSNIGLAQVSLDANANLRATMDINWSSRPDTLRLTVPAETAYGFHPRVAVRLLGADRAAEPAEVTLRPGQLADLPLAAGVTQTRLAFTSTGTYVASAPSVPGRGLVLLTPFQVTDGDARLRLEVTDDRILNLACRTAEQTAACGTRDGDTWTVEVLAAGEYVIAQVDLAPAAR
jgi:hypothetical protein